MKSPGALSNSMKATRLIKSPILGHLCHVFRLLCRARFLISDLMEKKKLVYHRYRRNRKKNMYRQYSSMRLHYNWCSSHVVPEPDSIGGEFGMYYDSTWNSVVPMEEESHDAEGPPPPSGYPRWMEEKKKAQNPTCDADDEINRLAEAFIANCHEKFRLEKQESYRMYQEMLARGM